MGCDACHSVAAPCRKLATIQPAAFNDRLIASLDAFQFVDDDHAAVEVHARNLQSWWT
jgi:hypothetical protein